ncbi:uncharacterized protein LOC127254838 [Andrographis paniculata]|uniref:uncharacterized protein LOC127254838 n=1 Tax=Andrographis paniculata TaxID=175694 RepID=UPI0021E84894|nr:uncharacterized protein LOC127254838 [Andrographis paniculata]
MVVMEISGSALPAILGSVFLLYLAVSNALTSAIDSATLPSCFHRRNGDAIECEVEQAEHEIARLESILDERTREVESKGWHFRDCEKKIEALNARIESEKAALSIFERDYLNASRKLNNLEEEVKVLWAASRTNNFEIHSLEYKALDAERRLKDATLQVTEMAEIVSEQWIQIQQLEQAVHMAEIRTSKIRKELWRRCPVVKFFITLYEDCLETLEGILYPYIPGAYSLLGKCKSIALQSFAAGKRYHHQLQGFIKNAMSRNELTAALAHQEVVFFVASALVAFPIMSICMLLLSQSS